MATAKELEPKKVVDRVIGGDVATYFDNPRATRADMRNQKGMEGNIPPGSMTYLHQKNKVIQFYWYEPDATERELPSLIDDGYDFVKQTDFECHFAGWRWDAEGKLRYGNRRMMWRDGRLWEEARQSREEEAINKVQHDREQFHAQASQYGLGTMERDEAGNLREVVKMGQKFNYT